MPHSPEEKKRVMTRLRRIKGQAEALERAVEEGTECSALLQQLAALRGAATGLMAEVLESHLRETFQPLKYGQHLEGKMPIDHSPLSKQADIGEEIDQLMRIVRSYLK